MELTRADTVRAHQGDTLDLVLYRARGDTAGLEAALELNRAIADLGPVLPHGTAVRLPEPASAAPAAAQVNLWD